MTTRVMDSQHPPGRPCHWVVAVGAALVLGGCAGLDRTSSAGSPEPVPAAPAPAVAEAPAVAPADPATSSSPPGSTSVAPVTQSVTPVMAAPAPRPNAAFDGSEAMLELLRDAYQFRLLNGPQLAAEIDRMERLERNRLDARQRLRWALALSQTLQVQDTQKALGLVQEVLESPDEQSVALRPLAHLLGQMFREQRRLDAQNERLSQQLRDNQRRVEQLNDRIEAMRAIERSLNRPAPLPAAPRPATP